jgi:hypothetical protein
VVFRHLWTKEQELLNTTYKHKFLYQNLKTNQRFLNPVSKSTNFKSFPEEGIPIDDINNITFSEILMKQYEININDPLFLDFSKLDEFIKSQKDQTYVSTETQIQQEIQTETDISINTNREVVMNNKQSENQFKQDDKIVNFENLFRGGIPVLRLFDEYNTQNGPDVKDFSKDLPKDFPKNIHVSREFAVLFSNNFPNFRWFKYPMSRNNYYPNFDVSELFNFYYIKTQISPSDLLYIIITPFEYERLSEIIRYRQISNIEIPGSFIIKNKFRGKMYANNYNAEKEIDTIHDYLVTMIMGTEFKQGNCIRIVKNLIEINNGFAKANEFVDIFKYTIKVLTKMYHVNNFNTILQICLNNIVQSYEKSKNIDLFNSFIKQHFITKQNLDKTKS